MAETHMRLGRLRWQAVAPGPPKEGRANMASETATAPVTAKKVKTAKAKKKRPGRPRDESIYYVVAIKDWEWSFMFGVSPRHESEGPYSDYRHLRLRGTLLRPKKVKAQEVELSFLPHHDLNESERKRQHEPKSVGSLQLYRGKLEGILSIPSDALPPVLQMVIADRFRFVVLDGDKLHYGQGRVRSYHLDMTHSDDDLPPEA